MAQAEGGEAALLSVIVSEGARLLAELCGLCVERLLAVGKSLAAHARTQRPADDGICWPPAPLHRALLLRQQVSPFCRMSHP